MSPSDTRPQAFRLDDPSLVLGPSEIAPDEASTATELAVEAEIAAVGPRRRRGMRWGALFWATLATLVSLSLGLMLDQLVRDLFARYDWLGWLGLAATLLFVLALIGIALRELAGLWRLERIERLHDKAADALAADDPALARAVGRDLVGVFAGRPETARGRAALSSHLGEVIDAADLLNLAERELLRPMDLAARRLVMDAARRVSVVTAVSPRASVDILFVLVESLRLVRRLATLYGGRPGALGLMRLAREVTAHLAVTGGLAMTEGLVQQIVGHGLAARLSARLGEGVVNGLLTARVGLAAIAVCRPLPFLKAPPVSLKDVMAELVRIGEQQKA